MVVFLWLPRITGEQLCGEKILKRLPCATPPAIHTVDNCPCYTHNRSLKMRIDINGSHYRVD